MTAHCFQLDIWKKIFRIFIRKNTQYQEIGDLFTPRNTFLQKWHACKKKFTVKNLKKLFCAQSVTFDLFKTGIPENSRTWFIWALKKKVSLVWLKITFYLRLTHMKNIHGRKNSGKGVVLICKLWPLWSQQKKNKQNLGYLSPKEKSTSLVLLKIPFYVSRQISKTSIPIFFWKGVTLKLWSSLQNQHSRKQQNLRDLSPKEETTSLVLLKIYFYVRQEHIQNFQNRKNYGKGVVLKLYSLISLKPTFVKTADSELFEPWRKKHFTGPPQNTFLCKVDAYLKLPLFSNCDLGSLWNHHSQKEQNQRYLSPNDKRTSLVLLKIPFY